MGIVPLIVATLLFSGALLAADERLEVQKYINRGFAYAAKHDYENARRNFDTAVRKYPKSADAHYTRGVFWLNQHDYNSALRDFDKAVRIEPTALMGSISRGVAYARLGKYDLALADYNRVLSLHPKGAVRAAVLNNRGWLEATCPDGKFRNGQQALADAKQAVGYGRWMKASCLGTLAAAYAEVGNFESAIKYQKQAMASETEADPLRDAEKQLNSFQRHHPYRDTNP